MSRALNPDRLCASASDGGQGLRTMTAVCGVLGSIMPAFARYEQPPLFGRRGM